MSGQIEQIVREKIAAAVDAPPPRLTRRDAELPTIPGKALAVIGMRRAGKTSFLHQCRADLIAAGRTPNRMLYFNFEDERLAGLTAADFHVIPDTHLRMYPEPANEPVSLFLDEIQLVSGWETVIRRLLDTPGHEVFLSGSSAKLLIRVRLRPGCLTLQGISGFACLVRRVSGRNRMRLTRLSCGL